jgi:hypothetical protein
MIIRWELMIKPIGANDHETRSNSTQFIHIFTNISLATTIIQFLSFQRKRGLISQRWQNPLLDEVLLKANFLCIQHATNLESEITTLNESMTQYLRLGKATKRPNGFVRVHNLKFRREISSQGNITSKNKKVVKYLQWEIGDIFQKSSYDSFFLKD